MRTNIVKCVDEKTQKEIYERYLKKDLKNKTKLAKEYNISTRTLGRIISYFEAEEVLVVIAHNYDYTLTRSELTILEDGIARTITAKYPSFKEFKKKLIESDFSDEVLADVYVKMDMKTYIETFVIEDITVNHELGKVFYGAFPISNELTNLILSKLDTGTMKGVETLVKFLSKLMKNPKVNVVDELYNFLMHNDIQINPDGYIMGYKGVRDDYNDMHSNTIYNGVGETIVMPRSEVNSDPQQTCSAGLHVGSLEYASSFGERTMVVLVNPEHVVSVPVDYNGQKMRCCQYTVIEEIV